MESHEIIHNPDPYVWAAEFCKIARERGFSPFVEDNEHWLAAWFACAMMNGYDRARNKMKE